MSNQAWSRRFCLVLSSRLPSWRTEGPSVKTGWNMCPAVLKAEQKQLSFRTWNRITALLKFAQDQLLAESGRKSVWCWKSGEKKITPGWKLDKIQFSKHRLVRGKCLTYRLWRCNVAWDFSERWGNGASVSTSPFLFCRRRRRHRLVCVTVRRRVIQLHHRWQLQSV